MRDLKAKVEVLWAYAGEILLTALIYWLLSHHFGSDALRRFVIDTAPQWGSLTEYLFGVSAAIWIAVFASIMLTAFGRYLREQRASGVYLGATAVSMFACLAAAVSVKLTAVYKSAWLAYATLTCLLYGLINFVTLVKNVVELVSFYLSFRATQQNRAQKAGPAHNLTP
jgi:hypothetical protein